MQEMVQDALRPIRFNEDRGYDFTFNLLGIETLIADRPEMEEICGMLRTALAQ